MLTDHKANAVNEAIEIEPMCAEGATDCPVYDLSFAGERVTLRFQNGPIGEVGVNGITGEALLAVVLDRLRRFQKGQFSCRENAVAITKLEEGLMWLQKRTRDRLARGVEGFNKP